MPSVELLIPALVFVIFSTIGGIVLLAGGRNKKVLATRLEQIRTENELPDAVVVDKPSPLAEMLGRLGGASVLGGPSPKLKASLARGATTSAARRSCSSASRSP